MHSNQIISDTITDWRTDPSLCLKLAFLRAHADALRSAQLLPATFAG